MAAPLPWEKDKLVDAPQAAPTPQTAPGGPAPAPVARTNPPPLIAAERKPLNDLEQAQLDDLLQKQRHGGLEPDKYQALLSTRGALPGVLAAIDELEASYNKNLKGQKRGGVLGFGGERNVTGLLPRAIAPQGVNEFNDTSRQLLNPLIPLFGLTAGQVNQLAEITARFGPLLPTGNDADHNIEEKIARLRRNAIEQAQKNDYVRAQMGIDTENDAANAAASTPPLDSTDQTQTDQKEPPPLLGPSTPPTGPTPPPPAPGQPPPAPGQPPADQTTVATGDTKTINTMPGANKHILQMYKGGATDTDILDYLKQRGATDGQLQGAAESLRGYHDWEAKHPEYKGGPKSVDVEHLQVPTTGFEKFAASGPGAMAAAAGDVVTGGHIDNFVSALGGDADAANRALDALRAVHPNWALAGDVAGAVGTFAGGGAALKGLGKGLELATAAPELLAAGETAATAAPEVAAATTAATAAPEVAAAVPEALAATTKAAPSAVGAFAPRALAADAAIGGYTQSGQGGQQLIDPYKTATGAVLGAAGGAATRGALNTAGAALSPTGGKLGAVMEAGTEPSVGQRMSASDSWLGKAVGSAEELFARIPGLGGVQAATRNRAIDQAQRGAFNQALGELKPFEPFFKGVSQLPDGVVKGTAAQGRMQSVFTKAYDLARSRMTMRPVGDWAKNFGELQQEIGFLSPDSQAIFHKYAATLGGKLKAGGGQLSGDQYKNFVSKLGQRASDIARNPKGDIELATALSNLKQIVDDAARQTSGPEASALLDAADKGFAKSVIIDNAGRTGSGEAGEFTGQQLKGAVRTGDKSRRSRAYLRGEANMQDYATSMEALGKPSEGGANLPNVAGGAFAAGTLGGGGAVAATGHPAGFIPIAGWAASTAATLPGARTVLAKGFMAPRPGFMRPYTDVARRAFELAGKYGGPLLVPHIVENQEHAPER